MSCMDVQIGLLRSLNAKELMLLNCGTGEDSCKSRGLQMIETVNPRGNQSSMFIGGTNAKAEIPVLWPPYAKS